MKIKVGIIFGGQSVEHEVSIISALQAIEYLDKEKYEIVPIYISKEKIWYTGTNLLELDNYKDLESLKKNSKRVTLCKINDEFSLLNTNGLINKVVNKIDIAFPIVHGQNVEDGTLIGYLETIGIPYVGSGVMASSIGQDKVLMKQIFESEQIPVVSYTWFYDTEFLNDQDRILKDIKKLGYPVIVKPASLGSSVGINFVKSSKDIVNAINEAIEYDRKIVVEKAISDLTEVNCSVIGNYEIQETSLIEEVKSKNEFLTFDDKYIGESKSKGSSKGMLNTQRIIPAKIDKKYIKEVESLSKKVFRVLNLSGLCRIDFLIDKKNELVYVNEPNIIPGSLAFYLWEPKGKKYKELLDDLITLGIKEYKNKSKKTTYFDSNILNNCNGLKGIKSSISKVNATFKG